VSGKGGGAKVERVYFRQASCPGIEVAVILNRADETATVRDDGTRSSLSCQHFA